MPTSTSHTETWTGGAGGAWDVAGNWQIAGTTATTAPGPLDTATITGGTTPLLIEGPGAATAVVVHRSVLLNGAFNFATLATDGSLTITGSTALGTVSITGGGVAELGSSVTVTGGISVDGASCLEVGSIAFWPGWLKLAAGTTLAGTGPVAAYADIEGTVLSQGMVFQKFIGGGGVIDLGPAGASVGVVSAGFNLTFAASGATLTIAAGSLAGMGGVLTGFAAGDAIDLAGLAVASASFAPQSASQGALTLFAASGAVLGSLTLSGNVAADSAASFTAQSDGAGGTKIVAVGSTGASYVWAGSAGGTWQSAADWQLAGSTALFAPDALDSVAITGAASVAITGSGAAAAVVTHRAVLLDGAFSFATLDIDGTLSLTGGAVTLGALGQTGAAVPATLIDSAAALTVAGSVVLGSATISGGGVAEFGPGVTVSQGVSVDGASCLEVGSIAFWSGWLKLAAGTTLAGSGRIAAYADIEGTVLSQGLVFGNFIGGGGVIDILDSGVTVGTVSGGFRLAFAAAGAVLTVAAGSLSAMGGVLSGFAAGDAIDLAGVAGASASYTATGATAGVLRIGGTALAVSGSAAQQAGASAIAVPDGAGGTLVMLAAAAGTLSPGNATAQTETWTGGAGGAWDVAGNWQNAGTTATTAPGSLDTATITGGTTPLLIEGPGAATAVVVHRSVLLDGAFNFATLATDGSLTVTGSTALGTVSITGGGVAEFGTSVTVTGGIAVDGASALELGSIAFWPGWLKLAAGTTLAGTGPVAAYADIEGTVLSQGLVFGKFIGGGGVIDLGPAGASVGVVSAGFNLTFAASGATLTIAAGSLAGMGGVLTGFAAGDAIDLAGLAVASASFAPQSASQGALTLFAASGAVLGSLTLSGNVAADSAASFTAQSDGAGGTKIVAVGSTGASYVWAGSAGGTWQSAADWQLAGSTALFAPDALDSVAITGAASVAITGSGAAAAVVTHRAVLLDGAFSFATLDIDGTLSLTGGAVTLGALGQTGAAVPATLIDSAAALTVAGSVVLGSATITGGGVAEFGPGVTVSQGVSVDGASCLEVGSIAFWSGWLKLAAGTTLAGSGRIAAYADIEGTVLSQGLVFGNFIGGGGVIDILDSGVTVGTVSGGFRLAFAAAGAVLTVAAGSLSAMGGALSGFAAGDAIDLAGVAGASASYTATGANAGVLRIGGTALAVSGPAAQQAGASAIAVPDGAGGTLVMLAAAAGTLSPGNATSHTETWTGGAGGAWDVAGNWQIAGTTATTAPGPLDTATITGNQMPVVLIGPGAASAVITHRSVLLDGAFNFATLDIDGTLTLAGGTLGLGALGQTGAAVPATLIDSAALTVAGSSVLGSATITGGGVADFGPSVTVSAGISVDGASCLELGSIAFWPGWLKLAAGTTFAGSGSVAAYADIEGTVLSQGLVFAKFIGGGGVIDIFDSGVTVGAVSAGFRLAFAAAGTALTVAAGSLSAMGGALSFFAAGNAIDLAGVAAASATYAARDASDGVLTIADVTGAILGTIALTGSAAGYSAATFGVLTDGHGGSLISETAAALQQALHIHPA